MKQVTVLFSWLQRAIHIQLVYTPVLRIRDVFPSRIPDQGSKRFSDPGSRSALKNLSILTQKIDSTHSEIGFKLFISVRDLDFFPSRIPGSKRHRIPDQDLQHWYIFFTLSPLLTCERYYLPWWCRWPWTGPGSPSCGPCRAPCSRWRPVCSAGPALIYEKYKTSVANPWHSGTDPATN